MSSAPQAPQEHEEIHLPSPSLQPIATSFGIALSVFGLVPDARIWRFALVAIGLTIALIAGWLWARDAIREYEHLHD